MNFFVDTLSISPNIFSIFLFHTTFHHPFLCFPCVPFSFYYFSIDSNRKISRSMTTLESRYAVYGWYFALIAFFFFFFPSHKVQRDPNEALSRSQNHRFSFHTRVTFVPVLYFKSPLSLLFPFPYISKLSLKHSLFLYIHYTYKHTRLDLTFAYIFNTYWNFRRRVSVDSYRKSSVDCCRTDIWCHSRK